MRIDISLDNAEHHNVTDVLVLSNPSGAQNVSCLGLCGRDFRPKTYAQYGLGTFKPQLSVSM